MTMPPADDPGSSPDTNIPAQTRILPPDVTTPIDDPVTPDGPSVLPMPFGSYALVGAAVLALIVLVITFAVVGSHLDDDLAHQMTVPLLICGVLLVMGGAAMAAVDWRSAYESASRGPQGFGEDPAKVIDALGKLKGAALVLVSGLVLLLGLAWIAASSADDSPANPPAPAPSSVSPSATPQ
jgi:hypothetical protein